MGARRRLNTKECQCFECLKPNFTKFISTFIVCDTCGNKRCPHATDHRLGCTNSNDPGQLGSRYGIYPHPSIELLDFLDAANEDKE